jgi:hypothetical protein
MPGGVLKHYRMPCGAKASGRLKLKILSPQKQTLQWELPCLGNFGSITTGYKEKQHCLFGQ